MLYKSLSPILTDYFIDDHAQVGECETTPLATWE